ncbi:MAG: hypothetical protein KHY89_09210 [Butyricicoccus pullicaecorum]|nr:hypothetical protein [Butyricicoccus pullicaecorum]
MQNNTKLNEFNGTAIYSFLETLPDGAQKLSALSDAIQQADSANDPYWRLLFRTDYACQAIFHDDAPKAIPAAAEFNAILKQYPEALPEELLTFSHLLIMQTAIEPINDLPQIPLSEWEQLLDEFQILTERYQLGERTYWAQMARFWQYIDKEKAFAYLKKSWNTPRDDMSDCEACEYSYAIYLSLLFGDRDAADMYAKPIKEHTVEYCKDTPKLMWLAYLEDALRRGDLTEAKPLADKLFDRIHADKSELNYLAAVLHCWAYTNLDKALEQLPLYVDWALSMWNQKIKYDFCKASWVCFHELSKKQDCISLPLSAAFPLYQEDNMYHTDALAHWFYAEAEKIAARFDARNGTDYFQHDLTQVCPASQINTVEQTS